MNLSTKVSFVKNFEVAYAPRFDNVTITDLSISKDEPRNYFDKGLIDILGVTIKDNKPAFADIFDANSLSSSEKLTLIKQISSFFVISEEDAKKILDFAH